MSTDNKIDWELIERDYRAGLLSIREIARNHGLTDKTIRKKAKTLEWVRDLSAKINEAARSALVRSQAAPADLEATEAEIIADAADKIVTVVRVQRKRITRQTELVDLLTQQLIDVAGKRDDFEQAIEAECEDDKTSERRTRLMKAVGLPVHASTAVNLANALKTLIGLERQALGIKDDSGPDPVNALSTLMGQIAGKTFKPVE